METKKLVNGYDKKEKSPHTGLLEDAGGMIYNFRKSKLMTQTDLGSLMGLKKSQICKIEKGDNLTISTISKAFAAMGIRPKLYLEPIVNTGATIDLVNDVVMTVSEFASAHSIAMNQAFRYLDDFGGIEYLLLSYNDVRNQSMANTIEDLTHICRKSGGRL